jgi:hypothetical protein
VEGEGKRQLCGGAPGLRTGAQMRRGRVGPVPVPFGRYVPGCEPEHPGGDDNGSVRTRKRLAERLDGAAIRVGSGPEAPGEGDVVLEREVDHAIRRGGCTP